MTGTGAPASARRFFDQATEVFETDPATALRIFREATDTDPSMADAWLCRIAAGDDNLTTLEELYRHGSRLHRESNRLGVHLAAAIKAGPYLSITVTEASHAGIALAGALIDDKQFDRAEAILDSPALLDSWENHQWRQHIRAYLMFATGRWPDVLAEAARVLPPQAVVMPALTAGNCVLAAHAAAHLGQARVALDWTSTAAKAAISPVDFPLIVADLAYLRGMVHRQLGDFLVASGLQPIDAEGQPFDPKLHEALGHESDPAQPDGVVLRQMRRGYRLADRLIRPSSVIVNKLG